MGDPHLHRRAARVSRVVRRDAKGRGWLAALAMLAAVVSSPTAEASDSAWDDIRAGLFQNRAIANDGAAVKLFAPRRAEDAALVPIRIFISGEHVPEARALTLIVDQNPAPVAATFRFGDLYRAGGDIGDRTIETRVRLESMSRVRAILELADGRLYEASQFVSGAGGCTSASLKDMDEAMSGLGRMRVRVDGDATRGEAWSELQIHIRHPNFSGMQIDTRTNAFAPALFVQEIDVDVGDGRLVEIESGIAISEDPHFKMSYASPGRTAVNLLVRDSEGREFRATHRR